MFKITDPREKAVASTFTLICVIAEVVLGILFSMNMLNIVWLIVPLAIYCFFAWVLPDLINKTKKDK